MSAGPLVVDSWAALALLRGEGAASRSMKRVLSRAHSGSVRLYMSIVNLGEVYYRLIQLRDEELAEEGVRRFRRLPIEIVGVREGLVFAAGRLKAAHRLSLADCYAVATAQERGAGLLTGDPEILALPRNVVRVVPLAR